MSSGQYTGKHAGSAGKQVGKPGRRPDTGNYTGKHRKGKR